MTTGATIHTTNGLWLDIKPRATAPPPPAPRAAPAPALEQREMAMAFSDLAAQQPAAPGAPAKPSGCPMHGGQP